MNYKLLICALTFISLANAQEVRVVDNKGTILKVRNNNVYTSNTDPNAAPNQVIENDIWIDTNTSPTITKVFDNSSQWAVINSGPSTYTGFFIISGNGVQSITGLPFKPSQISFVAHANVEGLNIDGDNEVGNNTRGINNSFGTVNGFARDDNGTTVQQFIYVGGHGNSINDISRYSSSSNCIGIRFGDQNGSDLGKITASLNSFNTNGFTIGVTYTNGIISLPNANPVLKVTRTDVLSEKLVVLFTAYK